MSEASGKPADKSTGTGRRFGVEITGRVDDYVAKADAALSRRGLPIEQRRAVVVQLRNQIMSKLTARAADASGATADDLNAVLAELDAQAKAATAEPAGSNAAIPRDAGGAASAIRDVAGATRTPASGGTPTNGGVTGGAIPRQPVTGARATAAGVSPIGANAATAAGVSATGLAATGATAMGATATRAGAAGANVPGATTRGTAAGGLSVGVPANRPAPDPARPAAPAPRHVPPRLSLTALLGGIWAPFFFLMWALSSVTIELQPGEAAPAWQPLLQFALLPLGLAAPLATTVMGLLALGQIQRSEGKQYGLSLALFDALLFPLLLLDVIVFYLSVTFGKSQDYLSIGMTSLVFGQAIPTVICVLGDYFLVTRAWAAVKPARKRR